MHLKMLCTKWRLFGLGLNELKMGSVIQDMYRWLDNPDHWLGEKGRNQLKMKYHTYLICAWRGVIRGRFHIWWFDAVRSETNKSEWYHHWNTWIIGIRWVNSLWPSDDIGRQTSWSTLVQVMACCLMAPSHYLNQCLLTINEIWHFFFKHISTYIQTISYTHISINIYTYDSQTCYTFLYLCIVKYGSHSQLSWSVPYLCVAYRPV